MLRRGSSLILKNYIIMNFANDGIEVRDDPTFAQITAGNTNIQSGIFWNNKEGAAGSAQIDEAARSWVEGEPNNVYVDPMVRNVRYEGNPDPRLKDGSPACAVGQAAQAASDGFLTTGGPCVGAFDQQVNWMDEWTFLGDEADYAGQ
jgi:hypothetical protein